MLNMLFDQFVVSLSDPKQTINGSKVIYVFLPVVISELLTQRSDSKYVFKPSHFS